MAFVRLVNPRNFDKRRMEFKNYVFKNSTGGGASVFDFECAIRKSQSICSHIYEFYGDVGGKPAAYWVFDLSEIQPTSGDPITCRQRTSSSGDKCHHNIEGATNGHLRRLAEKWELNDISFCHEDGVRPLTLDDVPDSDV